MSLNVIHAVFNSRLERVYRPLAIVLAVFADPDGGRVFPGAGTLADALGVTESAVRHHLGALKVRGIVVPVATRGDHTREYAFDLDRLKGYRPTAAAKVKTTNKNRPVTLHARATRARTAATSSRDANRHLTLHARASKPARPCQQPCTPMPTNLHARAISDAASLNDLQDLHDLQDLTVADATEHTHTETTETSDSVSCRTGSCTDSEYRRSAPDHSNAEKTKTAETTKTSDFVRVGEIAETIAGPAESQATPDGAVGAIDLAVARRALELAGRELNDRPANVEKHLRALCIERGLPYDAARLQPAIDAAIRSRDAAAREFVERARAITRQPRPTPSRRRRGRL